MESMQNAKKYLNPDQWQNIHDKTVSAVQYYISVRQLILCCQSYYICNITLEASMQKDFHTGECEALGGNHSCNKDRRI